jgi:2-phospho-L-lactate guanylyltransferase
MPAAPNITRSPRVLAALPLKPFASAKGRLARLLEAGPRADLSRAVAERVAAACDSACATTAVITADDGVAAWARRLGLEVVTEPDGGGLNGAARAAAGEALRRGLGWCIVHADLPFLTADDVVRVIEPLVTGAVVLAPSRDGGTNLLAATFPVAFGYGPGSFARHLAATRGFERRVVVTLGTALDLDTPEDLVGAAALPGGAWLRDYLS